MRNKILANLKLSNLQDLNTLQNSESSDEGAQAWAIPFADMMTYF